ncbi:MAG: hypothetical protein JO125_03795 [Chloroflexi bacterium]|nr:hypothetical protein [Ktedonobacteraceae bacterium]MBV9020099.1 hypothetical protein [Ktedonobacteraceae bacterium]MBV9706513.1 hypothetical protein [Chloroflexota bacterium]
MPDLNFEVVGVEAPRYAAVPTIIFKLRIDNTIAQEQVHSVVLHCQIQINVTRRRYTPEEQARLLELFGAPQRWGETLRPLLWTHANVMVPQFSGSITVDMPITCTYDFEVGGTKYFDALGEGEIPLTLLFSGTIFYKGETGNLQVSQISWSKEAVYRLPVALWREMIEYYYPNSAWIRLHKDVFDQLYRYKATNSLPTWEQVIGRLLQGSGEEAHS